MKVAPSSPWGETAASAQGERCRLPPEFHAALHRHVDFALQRLAEAPTDIPSWLEGDGPLRDALARRCPQAVFAGQRSGEDLAAHYASADLFVFPSLTDTFGLVILEAMAAGTPVAGFNVPGPRDLIPGTGAGAVNDDLAKACHEALTCSREKTRAYAETYSWRACAEQFVNNLEPLPVPERRRFWKRLARLRHALRIRRRKPKPDEGEAKAPAKAE